MHKSYFMTLDSIRGILACNVALAHFNGYSHFKDSTIIGRGDVYVDFFFVLSGFVIFANYRDKLLAGFGVLKFMFLRLGRLYPLHLAVLLAFIGADLFQMVFHIEGAAAFAPFSAPGEGIKEILANVFMVHSMHTINTLAFNGPSWSISVEIFTYLLFAIILIVAKQRYLWVVSGAIVVSAISLYLLKGELYAKLDYRFLRGVYGFGMGVLAYKAYETICQKKTALFQSDRAANFGECILLLLVIIYIGYFSFDGLSMFAPIVFFLSILLFSFEQGVVSKILKARPFVFLGVLSYSIYMIHIFIAGKLFIFPIRLLENWFGIDLTIESDGIEYYGYNLLSGTMLEIVYLLAVIVCSWISFKIIEEPFRKLSRKLVNVKK